MTQSYLQNSRKQKSKCHCCCCWWCCCCCWLYLRCISSSIAANCCWSCAEVICSMRSWLYVEWSIRANTPALLAIKWRICRSCSINSSIFSHYKGSTNTHLRPSLMNICTLIRCYNISTYFTSPLSPSACFKSGLLNTGNFSKIWSACRHHEIQNSELKNE